MAEDIPVTEMQECVVEEAKLPSNKTDYMKMCVAEKALCYPYEENSAEKLFNMVRDYFESVGLDTSFHSVYEEYKLLVNYYEEQKAKEFIQMRTEQITETMEMLGVDACKIAEYSPEVLSEVFGFGNMEYFAGIKLFNSVIDRLGVDMNQQRRYEVFDRIYEEGMIEKKQEYSRGSR